VSVISALCYVFYAVYLLSKYLFIFIYCLHEQMFESKSHTVVIGAMQKGILSEFLSTPETVPFYM